MFICKYDRTSLPPKKKSPQKGFLLVLVVLVVPQRYPRGTTLCSYRSLVSADIAAMSI